MFFDYALIYGHFRLPALGFNGAAYASIIAEFMGMFVVFAVIHFKKFHQTFSLYKYLRFDSNCRPSSWWTLINGTHIATIKEPFP